MTVSSSEIGSAAGREARSGRRLSLQKKVFFAGILTAGLLGLAEGAFRIIGVERPAPIRFRFMNPTHEKARQSESLFRPHRELFWELRPGFPDVNGGDAPNEHTFRGPAIELEKPTGTCRIAVLGESCTYGAGLSLEQTYARRLEDFLSRAHPERRIEVLNGGVPGYTIFHGRLVLERKILPFDPDVAVLYFGGFNDGKRAMGASDLQRFRERGGDSSWLHRLDEALAASHLYRALGASIASVVSAARTDPTEAQVLRAWLRGAPLYGVRVPSQEFEILLDEILDLCREHAVLPVIVLPELNLDFIEDECPKNWGTQHGRYLEIYRGILQRVATERAVLTVDQRKVYASYEDTRSVYLTRDPVHPDGKGHVLLASALSEKLAGTEVISRIDPVEPVQSPRAALSCGTLRVLRRDPRITWRLDAGPEHAGGHYRLLPSTRAIRWPETRPAWRFPLEPDWLTDLFLTQTDRAAARGWLGRLDRNGKAIVTVDLPERLFEVLEGDLIGFAFVASAEEPFSRRMSFEGTFVSNDVWLAVE